MLQEVINLQTKAVKEIISLINKNEKDEITFKAPTGSGKTYMMADLMNKVIKDNNDVIFLVSSLSKGSLAQQNYEKFIEYSENKSLKYINPYLINSDDSGEGDLFIPTDYNVYVLPRDLYKDKSKLKKGALIAFLKNITYKNGENKKIYVIKDECHIATNKLDMLSKEYFSKILNFSATPKVNRGQKPDVVISEVEAINAHLIKKVEYQDDILNQDDILDNVLNLDNALSKFEKIKQEYINNIGINPCMIIQISNKEKADEEVEQIKSVLASNHKDLKWMLIVDNEKKCDTNDILKSKNIAINKWKNYAKNNTSTIDVIIFKMVISEGWDIPRACMLYQVRNSKSKQLDEQVIGRIRRNPRLMDFEKLSIKSQELISKAYVWGVKSKDESIIREVKLISNDENNIIQKEIKLKTTRLKKIIENNKFNIEVLLNSKHKKIIPKSIFTLYDEYIQSSNEVQELYEKYVDSISKWFRFIENIDDISKKSKDVIRDYDKNMEITKDENGNEIEVSFPLISYYTESRYFEKINNWLWARSDGKTQFSFDSEAEKEWIEILFEMLNKYIQTENQGLIKSIEINEIIDNEKEKVKKYMLGKNFLANSEIKYEYYLHGIHSSYPDFIMKDYQDRIHIFEVKSLNNSNLLNIDSEEYKQKIDALKECYKYASKLTGYYFYIPIKEGSIWNIYQMNNGNEVLMNRKEFEIFIRNK